MSANTPNKSENTSELEAIVHTAVARALEAHTTPRKWGTAKQLATYGGVSPDTIERLADKGLIQSAYITPRARRYSFASFDAYVARHTYGKAA